MRIQPYRRDELTFAFCYHVYYRWQTYRAQRRPELAGLTLQDVQQIAEPYDLHVLESNAGEADVRLLASLRPQDSVSACASKLKGGTSKWLRQRTNLTAPADLLKKGYFAATSGKSTREQIEDYLSRQGQHHGYDNRVRPPVFVKEYTVPFGGRLQASHAATVLDLHLVFASWRRNGVFTAEAGRDTAGCWEALQTSGRFALRKVSFLPDHVHLAVRVHPAVVPAELAALLMNAAQEFMYQRYEGNIIRAKAERLWQPSAYVAGYGDLSTPALQQYVQDWSDAE